MSRPRHIASVTFLAFSAYFFLDELFFVQLRTIVDGVIQQFGLSHIAAYTLVGVPVFLATIWMHGKKAALASLGLNRGFVQGAGISLVFTLPMFFGYGLLFQLNASYSLNALLTGAIAAAVFEEIYFRGFLFGQLYRYTKLGFFPSVILGAALFGVVHLSQGSGLEEMIGIFLVTFIGGLLFAWVFTEWNFNLWVAIFLHLFMNLAWDLFSAGDNALGGDYANAFRLMTIALVISLTVFYKRRRGLPLAVNKGSLWYKK